MSRSPFFRSFPLSVLLILWVTGLILQMTDNSPLPVLPNLIGAEPVEKPDWKFETGDFPPLFPFHVEKGAPDNITNIQTWGNPWTDSGSDAPLTVHGDQFVKGEKPFHFFGTNLCFGANFCDRDEAERLAATLARFGIRVVRLHHMDNFSIWGKNIEKTLTEIDPEALDRLDYLIAQLQRRGIYVNINLHVSRKLDERDGFDKSDTFPQFCKGLDNFEPRMIDLQKKYARDLLTHVNPYTGRAYVNDPGVAMIEINNENALPSQWFWGELNELSGSCEDYFRKLWNDWLLEKYGSTENCLKTLHWEPEPLGENLFAGERVPESLTRGDSSSDVWGIEGDEESRQQLTIPETGTDLAFTFAIESNGKEFWIPQIKRTGISLEKGKLYTLSFQISANRKTRIDVSVMEDHEDWRNLGLYQNVEATPEPKRITITFRPVEEESNARLTFTKFEAGTEVTISDLEFRPGGSDGIEEGMRLEEGTIPLLQGGSEIHRYSEAVYHEFLRFLIDLEERYWSEMRRFVKEELGAKPPVTGTQLQYGAWSPQVKNDYCDSHAYWNHPVFPNTSWSANDWFIDNRALVNDQPGGAVSDLAIDRIVGKPYTVSEYDHPYPNLYGAEGNLFLASVAAFQGWTGVNQFAWSHSPDFDPETERLFFDLCGNQAKLVHLPACYAILERGDVTEGPGKFAFAPTLSPEESFQIIADHRFWLVMNNAKATDRRLALACWSGARLTGVGIDSSLPVGVKGIESWEELPESMSRPESGEFYNEFHELCWNHSDPDGGYFTVNTPGVKVFTGFVRGREFSLGGLRLSPGKTRLDWTTISITSANPEPRDKKGGQEGAEGIKEDGNGPNGEEEREIAPGRYLIAATGLVQNSGMILKEYSPGKITTAKNYGGKFGEAPVLCEGIPLKITLDQIAPERVRIYSLTSTGDRKTAIPVVGTEDGSTFQLGPEYQTLWYEMEIKE